ncbi:helix-turn-helix domain-containing protein [Pseudactinotalea sp. Z1748]|uniref:helix-turn-helix domain-containing protein n=1 Tax=Pseudactinotalea sp. Z1748 TaxID=3413027 RepID=UPI003C7E2741
MTERTAMQAPPPAEDGSMGASNGDAGWSAPATGAGGRSAHRPMVANNLQKWRLRRGLSVSALARAAEVSKSTISELERGASNPSLDTLWAIAKSLNVSLGAMFVDPGGVQEPAVRRYADAPALTAEGQAHQAKLLLGWQARGEIEIAFVSLDRGARRDSPGNAPGVVERVVCVQGEVEVGLTDNYSTLRVGDLITFRADRPHFYHAPHGPGELVVVQQYPESA